MKKATIRRLGIIMLLIIAFVVMFLFLVRLFLKKVYRQRNCEWANIDNVESHTKIDIPDIKDINCFYDPKTNTKHNYYVIDKSTVKMPPYISFSEFKPLGADINFKTDDFIRFNEDSLNKLKTRQSLFYKEETRKDGEYYKALLDTSTGQVWINLSYAD